MIIDPVNSLVTVLNAGCLHITTKRPLPNLLDGRIYPIGSESMSTDVNVLEHIADTTLSIDVM